MIQNNVPITPLFVHKILIMFLDNLKTFQITNNGRKKNFGKDDFLDSCAQLAIMYVIISELFEIEK